MKIIRIKAFVIDYFAILTIAFCISKLTSDDTGVWIAMFFLFMKDAVGQASLGKRIYHQFVEDTTKHSKLFYFRIVLRNITLIIFPLEIIIFFLSKGQRIGDILFKTKVVEGQPKPIEFKFLVIQTLVSMILSFLVLHLIAH